ncbi:hypothetical protein AL037_20820 [Salipiger aestuarii]|nr:hypothetical protein C357_14476 [Citreicella sp. 357]KAA8606040.1 hypothetical protein AL037_20820 [Salipiger aestuarii]
MVGFIEAHRDAHALALQQNANPAVAEPAPLGGDLRHLLADICAVRRAVSPDCLGIDTNQPARPALRDVVIPHHPERRISPLDQCRQFFPSRFFNTTLSSMVSAKQALELGILVLKGL